MQDLLAPSPSASRGHFIIPSFCVRYAIKGVSTAPPQPTLSGGAGPSVADHEAFWAEWALRIQTLEQGIEQARQQGISLSRAKRVLKELQAQANAAEAASKLETVLQRKPCRASVLKVSSSQPCALMDSVDD